MPHFFTVRWPLFARLQAVMLFPVAVVLASGVVPLQKFVSSRVVPLLSPTGGHLGLTPPEIVWVSITLVTIVPYLVVMLVADRFLTVRKGYALLSVIAIGACAWAGMRMAGALVVFAPKSFLDETKYPPFHQLAALAAGGAAFLLYLRPLWVGLRDAGDVAMRLLTERDGRVHQKQHFSHITTGDVYLRRTAEFRDWEPQQQLDGRSGPRENSAVKILYALTWIGMVVGVGAAYHNWDSLAAVVGGTSKDTRNAGLGANGAKSGLPFTPLVQAPPGRAIVVSAPMPVAAAPMPVVAAPLPGVAAPLPPVQRHGNAMPTVQTPSASSVNEAVAQRGPDGGFAFKTVVNGVEMPMMFDTGASAVAIRGEDATRIGIDMRQLNYSARVKTANGIAEVAPIVIDSLSIGDITVRHVVGLVAKKGAMQMNLLGQTFLARLAGYNVERDQLVLRGQ